MAAVVAFMYARKRAGIKADAEEREKNEQDRMNQTAMGRGNTMKNLQEAAARATIASKLGRAWRKRALSKGPFIRRKLLAQRLDLEETMMAGLARITIYICMFFLLYSASLVSVDARNGGTRVPKSLQFDLVMRKEPVIQEWLEVSTMQGVRDVLPKISSWAKQQSPSSSLRIQNHKKLILIGSESRLFAAGELQPALKLDVFRGEFSFAAWVDPRPSSLTSRPIIREYTKNNPDLNCWGWLYPSHFKYGAHDFHSIDKDVDWETTVYPPKGRRLIRDEVGHHALVVSNKSITFYLNGVSIGTEELPRMITNCNGQLEIGGKDLALSSFKVYDRALKPFEMLEIYEGGLPLADMASGSTMEEWVELPLAATNEKVALSTDRAVASVEDNRADLEINLMIDAGIEEAKYFQGDDPLYPPDSAPPVILRSGDETKISTAAEREKWIESGRPSNDTSLSSSRSIIADEYGSFFPVIESPVYADGSTYATLPAIMPAFNGFALTFWVRHFNPKAHISLQLKLISPDERRYLKVYIVHDLFGVDIVDQDASPPLDLQHAEYISFIENRQLNEKYSVEVGNFDNPGALVWRQVIFTVDASERRMKAYVDGQVLFDSWSGSRDNPQLKWRLPDTLDPSAFFSGLEVKSYQLKSLTDDEGFSTHHRRVSASDTEEAERIAYFKLAKVRLYMSGLSPEAIKDMHYRSTWPSGAKMQMCQEFTDETTLHFPDTKGYADTNNVDSHGRTCTDFGIAVRKNAAVCASPSAKTRCPVACRGKKECYDGSLYREFKTKTDESYRAIPKKTYRIFDRVMHLDRKDKITNPDVHSIICPSSKIDAAQMVKNCRAKSAAGGIEHDSRFHQSYFGTWEGFRRTDVTDCDELEASLDAGQCTWNASWVDDFKADFAESGRFSMTFWVHSVSTSRGRMMQDFWPSVHFFSKLWGPEGPEPLADIHEEVPELKRSLRIAVTPVSKEDQAVTLSPTNRVDYKKNWVMLYLSVERFPDEGVNGGGVICLGINALRQECRHTYHVTDDRWPGSAGWGPEEFLEAVEFTTSMLVSPIEVCASTKTPANLQKEYYKMLSNMTKLTGAMLSDQERIIEKATVEELDIQRFDQKYALISPPVIFQTRLGVGECAVNLTHEVAQSQFDLIEKTHCNDEELCPDIRSEKDVFFCSLTKEESNVTSYFGKAQSKFGDLVGFSDFLYSLTDSTYVMRDKKLLKSREYIDVHTDSAQILTVFHMPSSGLTTVMRFTADLSSLMVKPDLVFEHLPFVSKKDLQYLQILSGFLFFTCVLNCLQCISTIRRKLRTAKVLKIPVKKNVIVWCVVDIFISLVVFAVGIVVLHVGLDSERSVSLIVSEIAGVPFASEDVSFDEKVGIFFHGIDGLKQKIKTFTIIRAFMFACFLAMSLRLIQGMSAHPRTGMLTGTIVRGLDDLAHFGILFIVIFVFFSVMSTWVFGNTRQDFGSLESSMKSLFEQLLGVLPEDFQNDEFLICYVIVSNIVFYFLMLNFVLAIVVEAYMKVRDGIEELEVEMSVMEDLYIVLQSAFLCTFYQWPDFDELKDMLEKKIASVFVTQEHLRVAGVSVKVSRQIFNFYSKIPVLHVDIVKENPYRRWQEEGIIPDMPELAADRSASVHSSQRRVSTNVIESSGDGSFKFSLTVKEDSATEGEGTRRRHNRHRRVSVDSSGSTESLIPNGHSSSRSVSAAPMRSSFQSDSTIPHDTLPEIGNSSLPTRFYYSKPQIGKVGSSAKRFVPTTVPRGLTSDESEFSMDDAPNLSVGHNAPVHRWSDVSTPNQSEIWDESDASQPRSVRSAATRTPLAVVVGLPVTATQELRLDKEDSRTKRSPLMPLPALTSKSGDSMNGAGDSMV